MATKEYCNRLMRVKEDDDGFLSDDYWARGIGWTSYGVAWSSWTPDEQRAVDTTRQRLGLTQPYGGG